MIRSLSQVLLAAALTMTAVSSSYQPNEIISLLEKSQSEINAEVKGLSAAQMEFKPAVDRWSVGDILEHITRTETFLLDLIKAKVLSSAPQPEKKDGERQRSSDAKLLAQIADRTRKGTSPEELDLRSYFADEMDAHQWFLLIGAHTQRHLAQMREVKASEGYPNNVTQHDSKVRIVLGINEFLGAALTVLRQDSDALLKARPAPDFIAFAVGYSKVDENEVELLRVGYKGATTSSASIKNLEESSKWLFVAEGVDTVTWFARSVISGKLMASHFPSPLKKVTTESSSRIRL